MQPVPHTIVSIHRML